MADYKRKNREGEDLCPQYQNLSTYSGLEQYGAEYDSVGSEDSAFANDYVSSHYGNW